MSGKDCDSTITVSLLLDEPSDNDNPGMSDTPKRKRRWLQFSLRSLLIFTVLCAIAAAWLGRKIERKRHEQAIVDSIREHGGEVAYDYGKDELEGSNSLRWLLGENFFNEVRVV